MTNTEATNGSSGPKDRAFFAQEASKTPVNSLTDEKQEAKEATPVPEEEENFIEPLQHLVKQLSWDHNDADYYLNNVHTKKILSEPNKNVAMAIHPNSVLSASPKDMKFLLYG